MSQSNVRVMFIHGLSNKPKEETLKQGLFRAIQEGLKKNQRIEITEDSVDFVSVYWADQMYPSPDAKYDPYSPCDEPLRAYKDRWFDKVRSDVLAGTENIADFVVELFGDRKNILKSKLDDLYEYYYGRKDHTGQPLDLRGILKDAIMESPDQRTFLIAHSMGSIIAYDVLREIGKTDKSFRIEHFVTMGSPLGLSLVCDMAMKQGDKRLRTPTVVDRWTNFSDKRDPVCAFDTHLQNDYEANSRGVHVRDDLVRNSWGGIHHKSYGYLRTPEFSKALAKFL